MHGRCYRISDRYKRANESVRRLEQNAENGVPARVVRLSTLENAVNGVPARAVRLANVGERTCA